MDIDNLTNHGITIIVKCKDYTTNSSYNLHHAETNIHSSDNPNNEPHVWTASCKPWDVVGITQRTGIH